MRRVCVPGGYPGISQKNSWNTSSGVQEHCPNVWDDSEFLNLDCDVRRIVDSSLWPDVKTTVKCVETLKFTTT